MREKQPSTVTDCEYADVFPMDQMELGRTDLVQHVVGTDNHKPIKQAPRKIPFSLRPKVETLVQEMSTQGVVKESSSPWASPIVLVSKPDGTTTFCVDYQRLNSITKVNEFPWMTVWTSYWAALISVH